jgi:penicillin-binding protein 2
MDWKKQRTGEAWYPGDTYINSIGQGFVQVSPIQACQMISAIANNGKFFQPTLLRQSRNRETGIVTPVTPEQKRAFTMDPAALAEIRRALLGVTTESNGTAHGAATPYASVAAKTGTAQVIAQKVPGRKLSASTQDHAWLVAYAPAENPQIAVAVLVEHGATAALQPRRWPESHRGVRKMLERRSLANLPWGMVGLIALIALIGLPPSTARPMRQKAPPRCSKQMIWIAAAWPSCS